MALELRSECERCKVSLADTSEAYICAYECTFCGKCNEEMQHACPNCENELAKRPRKVKACAICEPDAAETAVK